ncbi:cag pathogenicity island protein [Campylobacter lari]|nr:cag pathogenicity island protein [Campylobacter lari]EFT8805424.1 cag pathogenicity island protein [Campylobacter lari]EHJ5166017.1 cag pathogenicity island protein [Campylobacter lari]EJA3389050.1 cag pathogenicity island protein [Campylobacter lari]EJA8764546.1 cag pathogenicity island protein [Campylobacter lari]
MMKKTLSFLLLASVIFIGCASSAPKPKKLEGGSKLTLNNSLLEEKYRFVPKDSKLSNMDWIYQIELTKNKEGLLTNEQIVKTFLLAHNAKRIILIGEKNIIQEYEEYFKKNGVEAEMILQPISIIKGDKNTINMLFFHAKDGEINE